MPPVDTGCCCSVLLCLFYLGIFQDEQLVVLRYQANWKELNPWSNKLTTASDKNLIKMHYCAMDWCRLLTLLCASLFVSPWHFPRWTIGGASISGQLKRAKPLIKQTNNCIRQKSHQNALLCNGLMPPVDAALCFSFRFTLAFSKTNNWWCFDIRPIGRGCSGQCHHVQEVSSTARC